MRTMTEVGPIFQINKGGGDGGLGGGWVGEVLDIFQVTGQFGDNFF